MKNLSKIALNMCLVSVGIILLCIEGDFSFWDSVIELIGILCVFSGGVFAVLIHKKKEVDKP